MSYSKQEADRLLNRLEQHLEMDPNFSESDLAALHEMTQAWRGWIALGRGAKWVIVSLGLIAAAVTSWGILASVVKDWFKA
jgi:hypothetical protein